MNPLWFVCLLALSRGEKRDERGFDRGLLLALVLSGMAGQLPSAPGPSTVGAVAGSASCTPLDPCLLMMLALGTDLFGRRSEQGGKD
jgi:hypothetical protein